MIRVFVISGICLYREGLATMLDRSVSVEVVGAAKDVPEAIALYRSVSPPPDVILLDTLPVDGVARIRDLRDALPEARILALTVPNREGDVIAVAEAGISGFVTSDASVSELVEAIQSVARGEALCSPSIAAALLRRLALIARDRGGDETDVVLTARARSSP